MKVGLFRQAFLTHARPIAASPDAAPERDQVGIELHRPMVAAGPAGLYTLAVCIALREPPEPPSPGGLSPMTTSYPSAGGSVGDAVSDPSDSLYRGHSRWLIAFLRRRFGAEQAEDLAHDTFVRVVASRAEMRNPRAFLARVAINAARDQASARAARPRLVFDGALALDAAEASEQHEALLLKQAILALPPKLQEVFVLSRFAGLTYEEIARRCGISVKAVEARMTKALAMCAVLLD